MSKWWPSAEDRRRLRASTRLEWRIARRYLRSRRSARTASLNTIISIGGIAVGVTALIVVLGVMNGLRNDLRERILVANPHLRILTFGSGLRLDDWRSVIAQVRKEPGVVAASPEVISQAGITAGQDYGEGVNLLGFDPDFDYSALTKNARGRRVFPAAPDFGHLRHAPAEAADGDQARASAGADSVRDRLGKFQTVRSVRLQPDHVGF